MTDAPPPGHIHDLEGDVSIIPNTEELFEEQYKKENVEARSNIKLFSPMEEVLQAWKHCNIALWSPLQDIMQTPIPSNQYLLLAGHPYCTIHTNALAMWYRTTRANSTEFAT
jgi:hypothetical protein